MNIYLITQRLSQKPTWAIIQNIESDYIVIAMTPESAFKLAMRREYFDEETVDWSIIKIGTASDWTRARVFNAFPRYTENNPD